MLCLGGRQILFCKSSGLAKRLLRNDFLCLPFSTWVPIPKKDETTKNTFRVDILFHSAFILFMFVESNMILAKHIEAGFILLPNNLPP